MAGRDYKKIQQNHRDQQSVILVQGKGIPGTSNRAQREYERRRQGEQPAETTANKPVGSLGLSLEGSSAARRNAAASEEEVGSLGLALEDSPRRGVGSLDLPLEGQNGVGTLDLSLEESRRRGVGSLDLELESAKPEDAKDAKDKKDGRKAREEEPGGVGTLGLALEVSGARFTVMDPKSLVRSGPPDLSPTGELIRVGSVVEVLATAFKGGREFVKVRVVTPAPAAKGQEQQPAGPLVCWTLKSNLQQS